MENMEFNTWQMAQEYLEQKIINAKLENDYWTLRIQKLKEEQ